jgi:hypothetical protein
MDINNSSTYSPQMDPSTIMDILSDWNYWGSYDKTLVDRPEYLVRFRELFSRRIALFITGIRRAGKSSLAELFLKDLIKKGELRKQDVLIVNFEDPRFPAILTSEDLTRIYETYLSNLSPKDPIIVLDEVQKVDGWERFARYILESRDQRLIVTGSSSRVLDREVSEVLTGRHVDLEVHPLSFAEVLHFKNISFGGIDHPRNRIEIDRAFSEYRIWGGFPEVIMADTEAMKSSLLRSYFIDIINKDIIKRYQIESVGKLENLLDMYVTNIATIQSYNRMKDRVNLAIETVQKYTEYMANARIIFLLDKFDWSRWKQISSRKKVYLSDLGFYTMKGFRFSENRSKVLENMVAMELMRRKDPLTRIFYWMDYQDHEVDFVVVRGDKIKDLIQASAVSDIDSVEKREIRSLLKATRETGCENLLVVTEDLDSEEEYDGKKIRFVSIKRWLLDL